VKYSCDQREITLNIGLISKKTAFNQLKAVKRSASALAKISRFACRHGGGKRIIYEFRRAHTWVMR
jgi:hypothetical protein